MADISLIDELFHEQRDYLSSRGLSPAFTTKLKLEFCTGVLLKELGIQWQGITRGVLWRLREPTGQLTAAVGARVWYSHAGGQPKFLTPKDQPPQLYYSPLSDFTKLKQGDTVVICESYLKADVCAQATGLHCVGISGVWGWSKHKRIIEDFARLPWQTLGLSLVVCWDSNVQAANRDLLSLSVERLATELEKLGATVKAAYLPQRADGTDWGLDDYVVAQGAPALVDLVRGAGVVSTGLGEHLRVMNTEVAVVRALGRIVDLDTGVLMSREIFMNVVYGNRMAHGDDRKPIGVARAWLAWHGRGEVENIVYAPGQGQLTASGMYNTWVGMGCTPKADAVLAQLWESWLEQALPIREDRDWFCCWWASQLQTLGLKLNTALVLVGVSGIGKGWVSALMRRVWGGRNTASVDLATLGGRFNGAYAMKQLVIVEEAELPGWDGDRVYAKIKDMLTNEITVLEQKGLEPVAMLNHANVMLQGNKVDTFKVDSFDRRLAVFELNGVGIANVESYWDPRWAALEQGLPEAVYAWLLDYDCAGFNPKAAAPMTAAKREMIETTHSPRDLWILELKENYLDVMVVAGVRVDGTIASAGELEYVYQGGRVPLWELDKRDKDAMNKALRQARMPVANAGNKVKVGNTSTRMFLLKPGYACSSWTLEVKNRKFWAAHAVASN